MSKMIELLKQIGGLAIAPVSEGADIQNAILCEQLPFNILEFESGIEHNGWIVPKKWEILNAKIYKEKKCIYDGRMSPLGVIGYSESFVGSLSFDELKKHLFYKVDAPENIVYHCDNYYKPHKRDWGFSIPFSLFSNLSEGIYDIDLKTSHSPGKMKVLEYTHVGSSDEIIVLNAHNCHAAQLNDGPAGYVVFIEVLKRLKKMKTRYNYRLIVAPEHLGTVFYLNSLSEDEIKRFKFGIFMEMVGHDNPQFALQESFNGDSLIDFVAHNALSSKKDAYWSDSFRKIVGNDETVWEAVGIEVPMVSISRCESCENYYPEYHLNSDNISIISEKRLDESVDLIMDMIFIFENNYCIKRRFSGLLALSNPKYDLYLAPGTDPSINCMGKDNRAKWNYLMDCLPRYFDCKTTILEIATKHDVPFRELYSYLLKFQKKDLIEFV